jgi:2-C-methyl-D-erythritol 4-phosphate cytidylyltransferase
VPRYFALIPAAGTGSRLGAEDPKQYLGIGGVPMLEHTVRLFAAHPLIEDVWVVLAPGDRLFPERLRGAYGEKVEPLYCGGATRAASVFNGLLAARDAADADDWVLVHDAARPCLSAAALERLITEVGEDPTGGLLAVPVVDTLKESDADERVAATAERTALWQAQTPQMFRYGVLVEALRNGEAAGVTDESAAIERLGLKPRLVRGEARNFKVTYREELELASLILATDANGRP